MAAIFKGILDLVKGYQFSFVVAEVILSCLLGAFLPECYVVSLFIVDSFVQ